ncbi:MAG: conjugal transfer protein TraX [Lachnospiraceae bacterium]|nr:conjugal transfer protein TraX [Lachnospiraceae bacterium]
MKKSFNSNIIKLIAIIAMTIDHASDLPFPGFPIEPLPMALHFIGRLTAPIMWFFVCEGYHYTKDAKKYMLRLGIFAIISHFAYCFAFGISLNPFVGGIFNRTSVMYPLFVAVAVLYIDDHLSFSKGWKKTLLQTVLILSAFPADWSCIAVLSILGMYKKRGNLEAQMIAMIKWVFLYALVSYLFVNKGYAIVQIGVLMVYPVLKLYNGQKGNAKLMKWFFYIYYPVHLIIIGIIRCLIYGNVSIAV